MVDPGRANPLLTYIVGLLLGGTVAWAYINDEATTLLLNASFVLVVFALVAISEVGHRTGER